MLKKHCLGTSSLGLTGNIVQCMLDYLLRLTIIKEMLSEGHYSLLKTFHG